MPPKLANRRQQEASGSDDSFNVISENTIKLMINKAIKGAMKDFKITIQELIKKQFEEVRAEIDRVSAENELLKRQHEEAQTTISALEAKVTKADREINSNHEQWKETIRHCNENEQYSRRWCLRFQGIPVKENENCKDEVIKLLMENLEISSLRAHDLDAAHRIGRSRDGKPPTIIARFFRRDHCQKILTSRRKLKGKGKGISEDLTTMNIKLMNRARNHAGIKSTWSWNGHIWVQAENGRKARIDMFDDIDAAIDRAGRQRDP